MIASKHMHKAASAFGACCVLLALAAFSSAAWAQVGYVHEVSGSVSIQRVAARAVAAKVGDMFEAGTVFRTGTDGKLILKFADGEVVALGVHSALRVGQYRYVANNLRQSTSTLELMKGEMRFVTGSIGAANREGVHIIAGSSMIGILSPGGADFTVSVNPDPEEVGHAVVALGEISVRTPYGQIRKITAGQYAPWQSGRTPPRPMPFAAAPAVVQATAAALWATLLPANTPVAIAAAARMSAETAAVGAAMAAVGADTGLAGYVAEISNTVSIQTKAVRMATANAGTTFEAGTTFNTGTNGRVVLKFADGQLVVLGPGSVFGVAQYQFDPGNAKAGRSAIDLVNGAMRVITGYIHAANHEGISISAGESKIDILNTGLADFAVVVDTKDQEVGVAAVTAGEIAVYTPYGLIRKIAAGEAAPWQSGRAPFPPQPLAGAPAAIQAAVAALAATMLPENTPVVVEIAARAAAAVAAASRAQAAANADPGNAQLRAAAQAATERANLATQEAAAAAQSVAATLFATMLAALPPAVAGPAQAQIPAAAATMAPIPPAVTPGGGGGCTGSKC